MRADDVQRQHHFSGSRGRPAVITDYEDFTKMALSSEQLEELVGDSGQCVFNWSTRDGYPVGVVMAYLYRYGRFWTNCVAHRKRVAALRARPQSAVVVNKDGKMATFKGKSVIHSPQDADWDELKTWFYAALAGTERDPDNPAARSFERFLDGPHQVIIETADQGNQYAKRVIHWGGMETDRSRRWRDHAAPAHESRGPECMPGPDPGSARLRRRD